MRNFAAELLPERNESLRQSRAADQWVASTYETLQEQLQRGNYGGPIGRPDGLHSEYRLGLPVDYDFDRRTAFYRRLDWRLKADGWNAVQVVQLNNLEVLIRLFALVEPMVVVAAEIDPFAVELPVPSEAEDELPEYFIEALARAIVQYGAWRYTSGEREFISPHRIISVRQKFATKP